jgi:hypothetical protein
MSRTSVRQPWGFHIDFSHLKDLAFDIIKDLSFYATRCDTSEAQQPDNELHICALCDQVLNRGYLCRRLIRREEIWLMSYQGTMSMLHGLTLLNLQRLVEYVCSREWQQ